MIEMKNSGIDWIGEIPIHWEVRRLKSLLNSPLMYGANESPDNTDDCNPRYIRITDIDDFGNLNSDTYCTLSLDKAKPYLLNSGDVLFARSGATAGKTYIHTNNDLACFAGYLIKAIPNKKILFPKYLFYFTKSKGYDNWKSSINIQATIQNIGADKYSILQLPVPPIEEQQAIADYLDKKTAEIDNQIKLLEQKLKAYEKLKLSLINEVVTRGLNKNITLKKSGIEWIGDIPAHWEVKRFKSFAKTIKGKSFDSLIEPLEGSYKVLSVECLRQDEALFYDYVFVDDEKQICTSNDIVVIWDGAGVGEFLKAKDGVLSSTIAKIQLTNKSVILPYIWYWRYKIEYRLKSIPTGMGIPHLNPNLLNNFKITIPPIEEQQAIADYLDKKTAEIDNNITLIDKKIKAYKRLKQSLIDEVVTGKRIIQ